VPAKSRQRSSSGDVRRQDAEPARSKPRQELADALAEADLNHRRAETRRLEVETEAQLRRIPHEIDLLKLDKERAEGEIAKQPVEEDKTRAQIDAAEAQAFRDWTMTLVPWLIVALGLIFGALDPSIHSVGIDVFSGKSAWLPR
jgi:hypothetical protein